MSNEESARVLVSAEQLRQWRESLGLEACANALLSMFQQSRSATHRAEAWDTLLELLTMEDENLSDSLLRQWTNELLNSITDTDPEVRCQGLSALANIAPYVRERADVIDSLVRCLYDESEAVRSQAISAASVFSNRRLLVALTKSLVSNNSHNPMSGDPDERRLWHALFALDSMVERLDLTLEERSGVAQRVFDALLLIISEPFASDLDIWKIGESLGEFIKGSVALINLKKMMAHTDPRVRDSAVHGLSHLGGVEATELIKHALCDPATEVREEAQKALLTTK
ncbi:MAG: HEAT repeat domain-containing protein [Pyrinomonadaceae bacterium]